MATQSHLYTAELAFAKDLAVQATELARQYYKTSFDYTIKNDNSPVMIADAQINELVVNAAQQQYPDYGVLGEEQSWQSKRDRLWVCDPIDGTVDFSMGIPTAMFSIALVENGQPVIAVTSDIASNSLFWAVKDNGAYMNDVALLVSKRQLQDAWLAFPTSLTMLNEKHQTYTKLVSQVCQTAMVHGPVFKGMLIAQGLCDDTYWPGVIHPWDTAAVKLIVEEAGGTFSSVTGEPQRSDDTVQGGMVVSNGIIHDEILQIVS